MLTLEQQQRGLLALIRHRPTPVDLNSDPWLEEVASSAGLKMVHAIALWWQRFQIEWQCRYTSRMMKRLGCFDSYLADYFRERSAPRSIEELSVQFLASLEDHDDPILRAVARPTCATFCAWAPIFPAESLANARCCVPDETNPDLSRAIHSNPDTQTRKQEVRHELSAHDALGAERDEE
jgi:hypothetical protein